MNRKLPNPLIIAVLLFFAWIIALLATPPERTLGGIVRWVYAHASLTQVALVLFLVAALLAVLYLLGGRRLYAWMQASGGLALALWLAGFLLSTIPARLSWGVWIDFAEPRTQMTLRVLAVGAGFLLLTRWIDQPRFTALAQLALSAVVLYLNRSTAVVRHPLNPIAQAGDPAIPLTYGLVFFIALLASAMLVLHLALKPSSSSHPADTTP